MDIAQLMQKQRDFYRTGKTRSAVFCCKALERLEKAVHRYEADLLAALSADLHKSGQEAYMTEIGMVYAEISYLKKHLPLWMLPRPALTPLAQFSAVSYAILEPYGEVLIMAPWNYPVQLCLEPLAGALAAGNCCIVKPSAYAPKSSAVLAELLREAFSPQLVAVVEGGREENTQLLAQRFDYIFFTGSVAVGKLVMEKAAQYLTPVTLELGGKSPCIIEKSAHIDLAAKRLLFGKILNCGQTCVAPDYVLVQSSVKEEFIASLKKWIVKMLGDAPLDNPAYPRMISEKHYRRVLQLIEGEHILAGGQSNDETLQIAPTLLDDVAPDAPVMQEEIFGPVLPLLTFDTLDEAEELILGHEKPLALYLFTQDKRVQSRILRDISFGGGCINDTIIHLATSRLPFGGVGASGMGAYHGKASFDTFSHHKTIIKKHTWLDLPLRYLPYTSGKENIIRHIVR